MKKSLIFLFTCLVMVPGALHAGCNSPTILGFDGNQDYDDDEFLYESKYQFDLAKAGYTNTGKQNSGNGVGYECDKVNATSCNDNSVVEMPSGHVWKGEVINEKRRYQCFARLMANDTWKVVQDNVCHTNAWGDVPVGKQVGKTLTKVDCSGYELTDPNGIEFVGLCREGPKFVCKAVKCIDGMTADNGVCKIVTPVPAPVVTPEPNPTPVPGPNPSPVVTPDPNPTPVPAPSPNPVVTPDPTPAPVVPTPSPKKTCKESRAGNPDGMACCDLASSVATWNGTSCVCTDSKLEFKNNNGRGECVMKAGTPVDPTFTCPDAGDAELIAAWKTKCAGNADVLARIADLEEYCRGTEKFREVYLGKRASVMDWVVTTCNGSNGGNLNLTINQNQQNNIVAQQQRNAQVKIQRITDLERELNTMAGQFETTVWRDAEGNFNTARLASDTIAAVVLGTTGGVVTSTVMKKKQVESGFEEIQCTIGGQVVATWGDQFSVGIH